MLKKIVIVGTSRGIGLATANYFAQFENVEIHCLSRKQGDLLVGDKINFHAFDLAHNVRQQAKNIFEKIGSIDILINNAGYLVSKPFGELTSEDLSRSYQINILGVIETVQAALPFLNPVESHIVNISSIGGFQGSVKFAGLTAYSTSKAALCSFTELFAEEHKDTSISMNCLCLGSVQTEMLEEAFPGYIASKQPEEMARYIGDFALSAHRFMRGKIIPVSTSTP
jgi:3-oxoacyl-[acyl-carrier protein] reductase